MYRRFLILFLCCFLTGSALVAQKPFQDEISAFRRQDSISFPGRSKILFIGSSSFRLWKDIQADFPKHPIINRAFGGSKLEDVLLYKDEIIKPYTPKQVVIYCGENDLAGGVTVDAVFQRFKILFSYIREISPKAEIIYVSIKPSPSRENIISKVKEANELIRGYMEKEKRAVFVDTFSLMLDKDGSIREDLFVDDRLHMNRKGYEIWKAVLEPYLK